MKENSNDNPKLDINKMILESEGLGESQSIYEPFASLLSEDGALEDSTPMISSLQDSLDVPRTDYDVNLTPLNKWRLVTRDGHIIRRLLFHGQSAQEGFGKVTGEYTSVPCPCNCSTSTQPTLDSNCPVTTELTCPNSLCDLSSNPSVKASSIMYPPRNIPLDPPSLSSLSSSSPSLPTDRNLSRVVYGDRLFVSGSCRVYTETGVRLLWSSLDSVVSLLAMDGAVDAGVVSALIGRGVGDRVQLMYSDIHANRQRVINVKNENQTNLASLGWKLQAVYDEKDDVIRKRDVTGDIQSSAIGSLTYDCVNAALERERSVVEEVWKKTSQPKARLPLHKPIFNGEITLPSFNMNQNTQKDDSNTETPNILKKNPETISVGSNDNDESWVVRCVNGVHEIFVRGACIWEWDLTIHDVESNIHTLITESNSHMAHKDRDESLNDIDRRRNLVQKYISLSPPLSLASIRQYLRRQRMSGNVLFGRGQMESAAERYRVGLAIAHIFFTKHYKLNKDQLSLCLSPFESSETWNTLIHNYILACSKIPSTNTSSQMSPQMLYKTTLLDEVRTSKKEAIGWKTWNWVCGWTKHGSEQNNPTKTEIADKNTDNPVEKASIEVVDEDDENEDRENGVDVQLGDNDLEDLLNKAITSTDKHLLVLNNKTETIRKYQNLLASYYSDKQSKEQSQKLPSQDKINTWKNVLLKAVESNMPLFSDNTHDGYVWQRVYYSQPYTSNNIEDIDEDSTDSNLNNGEAEGFSISVEYTNGYSTDVSLETLVSDIDSEIEKTKKGLGILQRKLTVLKHKQKKELIEAKKKQEVFGSSLKPGFLENRDIYDDKYIETPPNKVAQDIIAMNNRGNLQPGPVSVLWREFKELAANLKDMFGCGKKHKE